MFKVNNNFIVDFEHISHLALVFLLLTLSRWMPTWEKLKRRQSSLIRSNFQKDLHICFHINGLNILHSGDINKKKLPFTSFNPIGASVAFI